MGWYLYRLQDGASYAEADPKVRFVAAAGGCHVHIAAAAAPAAAPVKTLLVRATGLLWY